MPIRTPNMNPPIEPKMSGHISYDALQYFLYEVAEEAIIKIARTSSSTRLITTQHLAQRAWTSEAYGTGLGRQMRTKVMPIMPPKSAKTQASDPTVYWEVVSAPKILPPKMVRTQNRASLNVPMIFSKLKPISIWMSRLMKRWLKLKWRKNGKNRRWIWPQYLIT